MRRFFENTVTALCNHFLQTRYHVASIDQPALGNAVTFVLAQHARMPDYLRFPFFLATIAFGVTALLSAGLPFHLATSKGQARHIWIASRAGPFRDLLRFYEGLSIFAHGDAVGLSSADAAPLTPEARHKTPIGQYTDIVVIGSGPGGAITAALLAEAGRAVSLVEAGLHLTLEGTPEFSRAEMERKYRNGGITAAFGKTKISYVEGCCVGGGSEINAGLYHRTPDAMLAHWRSAYALDGASSDEMRPYFEANERDLSVSALQGPNPQASLKMREGAAKMGWSSMEVPRWFKYGGPDDHIGKKQSMTRTFIPRALRAGARLVTNTSVTRLSRDGKSWTLHCKDGQEIRCNTVFVCAGAIHTAVLLRRSGITKNVGDSLRLHPTVKVVARFPEQVNSQDMGVTVEQVKEFSPRLSFGVSVSRAPYISLAMLDHPTSQRSVDDGWQNMAIYYAMITGGNGSVRTFPGYHDPVVRYSLSKEDMRTLSEGARKLSELLFAAGATELYPTVKGTSPIRSEQELRALPEVLPAGRASLMSVHLFSSCPMGENKSKCAANSYGKIHGHDGLYINDASLLCTAPGVNPQGSIMAFARRNVAHFLEHNT